MWSTYFALGVLGLLAIGLVGWLIVGELGERRRSRAAAQKAGRFQRSTLSRAGDMP